MRGREGGEDASQGVLTFSLRRENVRPARRPAGRGEGEQGVSSSIVRGGEGIDDETRCERNARSSYHAVAPDGGSASAGCLLPLLGLRDREDWSARRRRGKESEEGGTHLQRHGRAFDERLLDLGDCVLDLWVGEEGQSVDRRKGRSEARRAHPELFVRLDEEVKLWQVVGTRFLARLVEDALVRDRRARRLDELRAGVRAGISDKPEQAEQRARGRDARAPSCPCWSPSSEPSAGSR